MHPAPPTVRPVHFWFRGQIQSVTDQPHTRTILQWLREDQHPYGTKEGCGEGDCGACTVVIGTRDDQAPEGLRLEAINSCIQFLPALDGKALFTVEDLAQDGQLHPVQKAMVDAHASQCGFCTPGIVMSLWAERENQNETPDREALCVTLSGNLCRCTGYRPILDAAQAAWKTPCGKLARGPIRQALEQLAAKPSLAYSYSDKHFYAPHTLEELSRLYASNPQARLLAGSTDVGLWVSKQLRELDDIIYLGAVEELKQIHTTPESLDIGAAVSLSDAFSALCTEHEGWGSLMTRFASRPIRNAGTLGGNVANGSPIGDSMPGLLALGGHVVLQRENETRELALEDFYLGYQKTALQPAEFIRTIKIPLVKSDKDGRHLFRTWKVSKRRDQDISAVCAAFSIKLDSLGKIKDARIAYGGMAAIPKRAFHAEAELIGQNLSEEVIRNAMRVLATDYQPISDMRASAEYRMQVARNLLLRLWYEFNERLMPEVIA
ncbi:xanthine dehydrogenase small subunit [Uliginosibacterium gangwonense]|uniref:xanthine dehydrogenase small subunit n=1 Tax=Uliginosibacterium gangwonense TaxID=392736 RepID=UPI00036C5D78|nr:xanthine dehydrogenase small subunit [Uliginosibacterium gangwonense]